MADKLLTPQQELFLERYTNPKSPTFGNALQSALEAGYSKDYADNIMALLPDWLSENIGDMKRLRKAESNLNQVQNLEIVDENGKVVTDVLRERNKVDLFIAERLNKNKYSTKTEQDIYVKELPQPILDVQEDNSNKEDNTTEEKN